jgi:hypothetical protein
VQGVRAAEQGTIAARQETLTHTEAVQHARQLQQQRVQHQQQQHLQQPQVFGKSMSRLGMSKDGSKGIVGVKRERSEQSAQGEGWEDEDVDGGLASLQGRLFHDINCQDSWSKPSPRAGEASAQGWSSKGVDRRIASSVAQSVSPRVGGASPATEERANLDATQDGTPDGTRDASAMAGPLAAPLSVPPEEMLQLQVKHLRRFMASYCERWAKKQRTMAGQTPSAKGATSAEAAVQQNTTPQQQQQSTAAFLQQYQASLTPSSHSLTPSSLTAAKEGMQDATKHDRPQQLDTADGAVDSRTAMVYTPCAGAASGASGADSSIAAAAGPTDEAHDEPSASPTGGPASHLASPSCPAGSSSIVSSIVMGKPDGEKANGPLAKAQSVSNTRLPMQQPMQKQMQQPMQLQATATVKTELCAGGRDL